MLKIVSRIDRRVPAATTAPNDDPYSTRRRSSRSYQTRCGMRWTSECAPVAIEDAQTGVSDGKVERARRYDPSRARSESAGVSPRSTARSKTAGVRPSITIRTSFLMRSVLCEDPQPGVTPAAARGDGGGKERTKHGSGIPEPRKKGECGDAERARHDDRPDSNRGPPPTYAPAHARNRREPAEKA